MDTIARTRRVNAYFIIIHNLVLLLTNTVITNGSPKMAKLLIEYGADVNRTYEEEYTMLMVLT